MHGRLWSLSILFASACSSSPDLYVELRTDLVAGVEFTTVHARVTDPNDVVLFDDRTAAGGDYVVGQRIADVTALVSGDYEVLVELIDGGDVVLHRTVLVRLTTSTVVTVLITRSCVDVVCPNDDPSLTECAGGRCVPRDCTDSDNPACDPQCASDGECPDPAATCSRGACISGLCFSRPDPAQCSGRVCHPDLGCLDLPDAGTNDAGSFDAGSFDAGSFDAGPTSCSGGCDDGDPCTDDACAGTTCTHVPNSASCDDGVFCNGPDVCSAGVCVHPGDPCPGSSVCDEGAGTCTGCSGAGDCPMPIYGGYGACVGFAGACGEAGTQSRDVTTYTCVDGTCSGSTSTEMQGCARDTDGTSCAATDYGGWSGCSYASTCAESATESRSVTTWFCAGGGCAPNSDTETRGCSRDTDGTMCAATDYGSWSGCSYDDECDESGSETRSATTHSCVGGTCGSAGGSEMRGCSRDTDNQACTGDRYPCDVFQCRTGTCSWIGDICGARACCMLGCEPGPVCPM